MHQEAMLKATLQQAVNSLIANKGSAFTAGLLEGVLMTLINSGNVTNEVKAELVARVAQHAQNAQYAQT